MSKYCGNCGSEMAQDEKFCAICGTKFESNVIATIDTPKKKLTNAVIDKELHNQKHTTWEYIGEFLLLGLMFVVVYLGRPGILLLSIPWAIGLYRMIKHDIRRNKLKYYVLDRPCIEKKFVEGDESPDEWLLWFQNMTKELNVAISVKQDFYDATEIGEEFFVVFLHDDKLPCLCYRKSEWTK